MTAYLILFIPSAINLLLQEQRKQLLELTVRSKVQHREAIHRCEVKGNGAP